MRFTEHEIETARDLIYDRRKFAGNADALVRNEGEARIEELPTASAIADEGVRVPSVCTYDPLTEFTTLFMGKTAQSIKPDISNLPIEEKLKHHIIDGEKIGLEDSLKVALEKYPPLEIINDILLESLEAEKAGLALYRQLLDLVRDRSVLLEEYARTMIAEEETHLGEVNKMLRKPGEITQFPVGS